MMNNQEETKYFSCKEIGDQFGASGVERARAKVEQAKQARQQAEQEKQARLQAAKDARAAKMRELGVTWTVGK